ncbi:MAG: hypothetical protein J1F67_08330 [Muribaculaceae bacterium]|nr:hypothetical protein [Muribaculaceae bacterium]
MNMNLFSNIKKVFSRKGFPSFIINTLYFIVSASLYSCSEDLDVSQGINTINDDYISLDIIIPQEKYIDTRADILNPNEIKELAVFIYNGETFIQKTTLSDSQIFADGENQYKVSIAKNDDAKKAESLKIYAVANPGNALNSLSSSPSISELQGVVAQDYCSSDGFYMAGQADVTSNTSVELTRAAGKVTVTNQTSDGKFKLTGFHIYGTAIDCFVSAGEIGKIRVGNKTSNDEDKGFINGENTPFTSAGYAMPSFTYKLVDGKDPVIYTYIVIEGTFENVKSYYALPLYSQSQDIYYDIKPNHWYDLILEEVNHKGQPTRDEAVKNPCDYVIYDIHEHTSNILSMASDGIHELGVTHDIELQSVEDNLGKDFNVYSNTFTVKIYSAKIEEQLDFNDVKLEIISGSDWMDLDKINKEELEPEDSLSDEDKALFGIQYKFTVSNKFERYTSQTGTIKVTWKGLEREINVSYNPSFQMDKACRATLFIYDDSDLTNPKYTIEKYWAFLQGENDNWTLFGVGSSDMAENKVRNQGFHFPMPYGNEVPVKTWTYKYEINFEDLQAQLNGETINGITATISGNDYFTGGNLVWDYNNDNLTGHLKLEKSTPNNYEYVTGKIVFNVSYGSSSSRAFTLNLYHTGFFHHDAGFDYDNEHILSYMKEKEFYYYEVVPLEKDSEGNQLYWLDRNIGAKSNKMFVEDGSISGLGKSTAKGLYLKICKYVEGAYKDPYVINDVCPPGYHIPGSSEWNTVRLSANFQANQETDENNVSYSATYFQSSVGKVYFPRAKYFHSDNNENISWHEEKAEMGDGSTGYYWTATPAPGMEKLEMGKWLRALYVNGANTTYMNTDVVTNKLNVRCVAGASIIPQDNHYISINVHNVTHVYLFDKVSGNALYSFPGKAVGTEASSQRWQNFSCTTSANVDNIGMIFVKESIDGGITIFTKDGDSFEIHNDLLTQTVKEATSDPNLYWNVERGKYYDLCYEKEVEGQDPIDLRQKRKEADKSIISDSQPEEDFCSYDENAQTSNSGTVIQPTYDFEKENEDEVEFKITQTTITGNDWGNNEDLKANVWANVEVGSTIKVYFKVTDGDLIIQTYAGWNERLNEYRIGNMHRHVNGSDVYVLEIEATKILLDKIKQTGLIFNGTHFALLGVTILPPGEVIPEVPTTIIYDSNENYWALNQGVIWTELSNEKFDWKNKAKEGDIMKFIVDVYWYPDAEFKFLCSNTGQTVKGYNGFNFTTNGSYQSISLTLTQEMINDLASNGGLRLESVQVALRRVTIERPIE